MKKKNFKDAIIEDRTIGHAVDSSVSIFEKEIRDIIESRFEKYLAAWPLKQAFFDSIEGGKRLRAFSSLLFYRLVGGKEDNGKKIAAAMELIHCASLVIDDELDKRQVRPDRNTSTIRGKYSPEEAMMVFALNVLYSTELVFEAADEFDEKHRNRLRELFVRTVSEGAMGEIMKWKFINKREIPSEETYWNSLVRSSGALFFQMACEAGALAASDDEKIIDKVTIIGYKLGELLQAGDDLKDTKEDMRDGFYSLAVIGYHNSLEETERDALEKKLKIGLSERELDNLYSKIMDSESTKQIFKELKDKGNEIIELLNYFSDSEEKKTLINVINYLRTRMKIA